MSRLPIRMRLTLAFATAMVIVLTLLGAFLYVRLQNSLDERIADELESRSAALADAVRLGEAAGLEPSYFRSEEGIAQVIRPDGTSLFPSGDPILSEDELATARSEGLRLDGGGFRLRADPVEGNVVVVGEFLEDRDEALEALLAQLLIALPIAVLMTSLVGYAVAGAALRPVEAMRRRAAEISTDTPERRLPLPAADDEIHRLGETLNAMLGRLDEGIARERRFVADASHELRTPLAALRAELELAARRPRSREELERALASAGEEVERLVRLAEDLLVLARADEGKLPIRVRDLAAADVLGTVVARNGHRAIAEGRELEVSVADDLIVHADRERLEQALHALVDNAFQHGEGSVLVSAREEGGVAVLAVRDNGPGFPPELLPRAFERFSQADPARSGGGSGLGLAIVDAIARAHGGSAEVANLGATGAVARLVLPSRLNAGDAALGDRCDVD